ncbi:MAG: hypothetical protein D6791_18065 [Chloroflexi bacterium]|nr:MAG: hypothetical protein D6791_18065 [Chloroflexota bacterium]
MSVQIPDNHTTSSPHIVIVNLHSTANAGDHVLFKVLFDHLRCRVPHGRFTLIANDPSSFRPYADQAQVLPSFFAWLKQTRRERPWVSWMGQAVLGAITVVLDGWLSARGNAKLGPMPDPVLRDIAKAYRQAQWVISCPGNFIYSRAHLAGLPILGPLSLLFLAHWYRKPLELAPQTIGPLWRGWERWLVAWVLRHAQRILLRDPVSVELVKALGVPPARYRLVPDLAFLYREADQDGAERLWARLGVADTTQGPRLGMTLLNWGAQHPRFRGQEAYEQGMASLASTFLDDHPQGQVFLFPQVCGPTWADDDRIPARRVWEQVRSHPRGSQVYLIDAPQPPAVLRAAYHTMDLFVGSRLHSNIFALTGGVPVIAVAYQDKTFGVMRMLGLEEWTVAIEEVDGDLLIRRYRRLWPERHRWRQKIQQAVSECVADLEHALDCLLAPSNEKEHL